ncbi:hypothetical protein IFR05_015077 [Cadophora sp. M221]|nr:hypothetical protein IFR05_015077 [Cadophora sp. M221]
MADKSMPPGPGQSVACLETSSSILTGTKPMGNPFQPDSVNAGAEDARMPTGNSGRSNASLGMKEHFSKYDAVVPAKETLCGEYLHSILPVSIDFRVKSQFPLQYSGSLTSALGLNNGTVIGSMLLTPRLPAVHEHQEPSRSILAAVTATTCNIQRSPG